MDILLQLYTFSLNRFCPWDAVESQFYNIKTVQANKVKYKNIKVINHTDIEILIYCGCVCVCGRERESVCVWERERESVCVCVCVCVCGRERECVCVCVCVGERECVCVCVYPYKILFKFRLIDWFDLIDWLIFTLSINALSCYMAWQQ